MLPLPKLNRLYFSFLPAIDAKLELPDVNDKERCQVVYDRGREEV